MKYAIINTDKVTKTDFLDSTFDSLAEAQERLREMLEDFYSENNFHYDETDDKTPGWYDCDNALILSDKVIASDNFMSFTRRDNEYHVEECNYSINMVQVNAPEDQYTGEQCQLNDYLQKDGFYSIEEAKEYIETHESTFECYGYEYYISCKGEIVEQNVKFF